LPADGFSCPYPCPSGRVSADTHGCMQNFHPRRSLPRAATHTPPPTATPSGRLWPPLSHPTTDPKPPLCTAPIHPPLTSSRASDEEIGLRAVTPPSLAPATASSTLGTYASSLTTLAPPAVLRLCRPHTTMPPAPGQANHHVEIDDVDSTTTRRPPPPYPAPRCRARNLPCARRLLHSRHLHAGQYLRPDHLPRCRSHVHHLCVVRLPRASPL
jgi:hypothetical protein